LSWKQVPVFGTGFNGPDDGARVIAVRCRGMGMVRLALRVERNINLAHSVYRNAVDRPLFRFKRIRHLGVCVVRKKTPVTGSRLSVLR